MNGDTYGMAIGKILEKLKSVSYSILNVEDEEHSCKTAVERYKRILEDRHLLKHSLLKGI